MVSPSSALSPDWERIFSVPFPSWRVRCPAIGRVVDLRPVGPSVGLGYPPQALGTPRDYRKIRTTMDPRGPAARWRISICGLIIFDLNRLQRLGLIT